MQMSNEELVSMIQAGEDHMSELWEQLEGLVKWKARRVMVAMESHGVIGVEFEDLYQTGYLALVRAVETYNRASGDFSTWFMYYVKNAFAEATGYRTHQGRKEPLNTALSLDKSIDGEADGTPFGEFVSDIKAEVAMKSVEDKLWQEQLHNALEEAIATLPEQIGDILRLRYYRGLTLTQVGKIKGVSYENARYKENKALQELQRSINACRLHSFYDY